MTQPDRISKRTMVIGKKVKHIPQRMCVACRESEAKRSLVRVVRSPEGVFIDPKGKAPGRGAYVHEQRACWQIALRGTLNQALRTELSPGERATLQAHCDALPPEEKAAGKGSPPMT